MVKFGIRFQSFQQWDISTVLDPHISLMDLNVSDSAGNGTGVIRPWCQGISGLWYLVVPSWTDDFQLDVVFIDDIWWHRDQVINHMYNTYIVIYLFKVDVTRYEIRHRQTSKTHYLPSNSYPGRIFATPCSRFAGVLKALWSRVILWEFGGAELMMIVGHHV